MNKIIVLDFMSALVDIHTINKSSEEEIEDYLINYYGSLSNIQWMVITDLKINYIEEKE